MITLKRRACSLTLGVTFYNKCASLSTARIKLLVQS
jgi:hypothetical protein